ncbi:MAG: oligosaccharide flippase family protein, partial [Cyanobacteria bacterium]|nr:oligosaccharide flippase family protein [Cyanobacteriota bacterium]
IYNHKPNIFRFKEFFSINFNLTTKNIGIIFLATLVVNITNFFYQIIMGRLLGPSEYGVLNVIFSFLLVAAAIMGTAQTTSAKYSSIYSAEKNNEKIRTFFFSITLRVLILTTIIFIILLIFMNRLSSFLNTTPTVPIIFLGIMVIEGSLISIGRGTLQGIRSFKNLGINLIIEVLLKLGLGVLLVYAGFKASGAILGFILATLIAYFFVYLPLGKILFRKKDNSIDDTIDFKKFYKNIFLILISTILFSLLSYVDVVLVKHFFTSFETGHYSAASQIGRIILYFTGALSLVVFPKFSEKFTRKESLKNIVFKSLVFVLIFSGIFLIICFFFPEFIIKIFYGTKYLPASALVFKYGLFMSIISLINLQIFYFISIDKFYYLIYLFFTIIGMVILIWFYHASLSSILMILIYSSVIVFILNILLMILPGRKKNNTWLKRRSQY